MCILYLYVWYIYVRAADILAMMIFDVLKGCSIRIWCSFRSLVVIKIAYRVPWSINVRICLFSLQDDGVVYHIVSEYIISHGFFCINLLYCEVLALVSSLSKQSKFIFACYGLGRGEGREDSSICYVMYGYHWYVVQVLISAHESILCWFGVVVYRFWCWLLNHSRLPSAFFVRWGPM